MNTIKKDFGMATNKNAHPTNQMSKILKKIILAVNLTYLSRNYAGWNWHLIRINE